jgi:SulP family sulfate permease
VEESLIMQTTMLENLRQRFTINRKNLGTDFIAGLTLGIESIPDSMASALLAGINPLTGLYTMIVATPIGALFTSSEFMHISTTSAISLAVGSSLIGIPSEMKLQAVFMLALMVGLIQIALGLLRMGFLVRFVPYSVMTGFLNGVAVLIILGQVKDFTGYKSAYANKVAQALDTALNLEDILLPTLIVGLTTIVLIVLLGKIKRLSKFSLVLAMVIASAVAALPRFTSVQLVGDVTNVPNALPNFNLPDFSLIFQLIIPAFALSIIGLVQGAGISQGYPNPDGKYPDPSGDFFGQGMANVATSFFQGMPAGGSLSGTALVVSAGAKTRWANVFVGILIAIIILLFADLVKLLAMPALAGLLIVVGFQTINPTAIQTVWQTGRIPQVVMLITFFGTLIMPLQYAVFLGVAISVMLYVFQQANRITLVELVPVKGGFPIEKPAPRHLSSHKITALYPYGSLFYAAAKTLEEILPAAEDAKRAVVILLLRGYDQFGSTMISVLDRYTRTVQGNQGRLMLAGVSDGVYSQLKRTGLLELIGQENVFLAQPQWGAAANEALEAAQLWLDSEILE